MRTRRKRPHRRAAKQRAEQRDELAAAVNSRYWKIAGIG
jgi:hypothetical protein